MSTDGSDGTATPGEAQEAAARAQASAGEAEDAAQEAEAAAEEAAAAAARAAVIASDAPLRAEEEALLEELGVDPDDPSLDSAIRTLEARATEDLPFGPPGPPLAERSPARDAFAATAGVIAALLLAFVIWAATEILVLILVAGFLATGLHPAVEVLQRRLSVSRGVAVAMVAFTLLAVLVGFFAFTVPTLATQANELREQAPRYAEDLRDAHPVLRSLDERLRWVAQVEAVTSEESLLGPAAAGGLVGLARGLLSLVFGTVTVAALTLYFLVSFPRLKRAAYRHVPRSRRARTSLLVDEMLDRVGGYVLGNLATSLVAGITTYVALRLLGVPHAVPLAIFVALTDLIPLVGAAVGAAAGTAVAFTVSVPIGLTAFAFFVVYQQFENLVLVPRVMQRTVDVSPATTIVAALIGAALLGVVGALLAVPVAAALQLLASEVWLPRQEVR